MSREKQGRALLVVAALFLVGFLILRAQQALHSALPVAGPVIYTVSSNCDTSLTYTGNGGVTLQQSGTQGGWSRQVDPGRVAHISARTSCSSSWVEVTIERNGHVFRDATSRGDGVTADASVSFR